LGTGDEMRSLASGGYWALASLACLVAGELRDVAASPTGDSDNPRRHGTPPEEPKHRLAVVVPAYRGDLDRAVASLERWPTECSPLTLQNVDLVLYYAEGEEDRVAVQEAADAVTESAGRCFANLRTVYAHLEKEVGRRSSGVRSLAGGISAALLVCPQRDDFACRLPPRCQKQKHLNMIICGGAAASPNTMDDA